MNVQQMRDEISKAYTWKNKVKKMTDKQVMAIYFSMKKRGVI